MHLCLARDVDDIVRFKIELGVEEKFMCKNVTKQVQGDTPM